MLVEQIKKFLHGDIAEDETTLKTHSRDASIFEVRPRAVIFPKDSEDIQNVVKFVSENKQHNPDLSITARSAGTDMTGGPLNDSLILSFTKYLNHVKVADGHATTEPGAYYRDFEKETLKQNLLLPSYPASREIAAMGGLINNNSGGEKSLVYGQTKDYLEEINVVLRDGKEHSFKKISKAELNQKMREEDFEGELYRKVFDLIEGNQELIKKSKPKVSKNSSGYQIWDVWDGENFNMAKLFAGAQGTLGIMTEAKLRLVKKKPHSGMLVIFMKDMNLVDDMVREVLPFKPSSFESFDDQTLKLAMRFFPGFLKSMGAKNLFSLGLSFLPEAWLMLTYGMPKLVLLVEFEEENHEMINKKLKDLHAKLQNYKVKTRFAPSEKAAKKYWVIRRESFSLLRHKIKDKQTAPFIDDMIVDPQKLPEFLPKLYKILDKYKFFYTVAGHIGNGNFHIIPLMVLAKEENRKKIWPASEEVYNLVLEYGGSITAEHNDGLVRSPYLLKMYGEEMFKVFEQIKNIFDPENIFNPRKKIGATIEYAAAHMKRG